MKGPWLLATRERTLPSVFREEPMPMERKRDAMNLEKEGQFKGVREEEEKEEEEARTRKAETGLTPILPLAQQTALPNQPK